MASSRLGISNSTFNPNSIGGRDGSANRIGIVLAVITDDTSELILKYNFSEVEQKNTTTIGHAAIRPLSDGTTSVTNSIVYPPFNPEEGIPLVGETVELISINGKLHYKRSLTGNINIGNAREDIDIKTFPQTQPPDSGKANDYSTDNQTGIASGGSSTEERKTKIGKYFES